MNKLQYAFKELTERFVKWDRRDDTKIVVRTQGYITQECHLIEQFLTAHGLRFHYQDFDRATGDTVTIYRHESIR